MQHLLVTQDFLPDLGGAARRYVALARKYPEPMSVSTVAARDAARYDAAEDFSVERRPFTRDHAASFVNRHRWARWLATRCRGRIHVLHCGDIRTTGSVVWRVHKRLRIPYVVYVSAADLASARARVKRRRGRRSVRLVLGDAAGVVATTDRVASMAVDLMRDAGISQPPPVAALGTGTDPMLFMPGRDSGTLRQRWGVRRAPIVLTVGTLAPHNGQDTGIGALALLRDEFPDLRYVLVGEGSDEARLRNLAADLDVMDRVGFAGAMRDDELPEAYATSTIYLDASRTEPPANITGHGFAILEAASAALPIIASDIGDAHSLLTDGETAVLVEPQSAQAIANAIASLLRDAELRATMGIAAREAVESRMNWVRIAADTARFVRECVANG